MMMMVWCWCDDDMMIGYNIDMMMIGYSDDDNMIMIGYSDDDDRWW